MKKNIVFCSVCFAVICSAQSRAALDRVFDFALLDDRGEFHQLSRYQHRDAVVLMAYDNFCEAMPFMLQDYRSIAEEFSAEDIQFLLIDSLDLGRSAVMDFNVGLPILEDDGQLVSESLGIQKAGEVLVFNPERLSIYYQARLVPNFPRP